VLLLVTAAVLSRYYLNVNVAFIRPVIVGRETIPLAPIPWTLMLRQGIATALVSLVAGVVAGCAVPRLRWAVGPCVIAVAALCNMLALTALWSVFDGRTAGPGGILGWELDFRTRSALDVAGVLVFAGVGGALSSRVTRHIRLSTVTSAAVAWIAAAWLQSLLRGRYLAGWEGVGVSEWSLPWLLLKAERAVPYLVAAWWLHSATRTGGPWKAALVVGAIPALQLFRGWVAFGTDTAWESVLRHVLWIAQPLVWSMVGAWLGGAVFGLVSRRQLSPSSARDAGR